MLKRVASTTPPFTLDFDRLYVAHTANDALDVINCAEDRYLYSIPNLTGVAGALVSRESNLIFTSNCGENTVGIFAPDDEERLVKIPVGLRPNGLAYDAGHGLLLVAHVGDPAVADSADREADRCHCTSGHCYCFRSGANPLGDLRCSLKGVLRQYR